MKKILLTCICFLLFITQVFAQVRQVSGTVKDENGATIPGITVKIKGTTQAVSTDGSGFFKITVPDNAILVVGGIGFETKEVVVGTSTNLSISLKSSNTALTEVVVTALGVKRDKRTLTYATQQVSGTALVDAKQDNLINAIAGKVAGVQITNSSGMPGSSSQIVIRGNSTLFGDNTALIVIDGVPVDNGEAGNPFGSLGAGGTTNRGGDIDPNIIESISVLKGSAATALYGSAGSRGVVLITTKNGASRNGDSKPVVTFSSSYSFDNPILPKFQDQYAQGLNGQYVNGNVEGNYSSYSWGPRIDTLKVNGQAVQKRNNVKDFFKTGHTTDNNLSISGNGDRSSYLVSYSYLKTDGTEPSTNYIRNSFFTKYTSKLADNLTLTTQFNYINVANHRLQEGNGLSNPLWTIYAAPISWNPLPETNPDGTQQLYRRSRNNPYWLVDNTGLQDNTNRILPVATLVYNPLKWLSVTERFGADIYFNKAEYHENTGVVGGDGLGQMFMRDNSFLQFNNDLIIEARKDLTKDLTLDAILGNNIFSQYTTSNYQNGADFSVPGFYNISNTNHVTASYNSALFRKIGFYAQANLEYKRMLTLALTGREDGSSVLSKNKQFYPYGSVSGGFIFTEALGLSNNKIFDYGKIRVSYSEVGSDNIGPYNLTNVYYQAGGFPIGSQNGFQLTNTNHYPLKSETYKEFEMGLETKFFSNRVSLDVTYYNKISNNLLSPNTPIAPATGFIAASLNAGSVRNKGIEIVLGGSPIKSKDFNWDVTVNFAKNQNTVVKLAPGLNFLQLGGFVNPGIFAYPGQPYNVIYGSHFLRNPQGQLLLSDNGYPQIANDLAPIGNATPKFIAGLTNTFNYKSFVFSFVLDWKHGGDILNLDNHYLFVYGTPIVTENRGSTKVFPGIIQSTGKVNTTPVVLDQNYYTNLLAAVDESSVEDGSYLKIRSVTLGYNFGSYLTGKVIKKLALTLTGTNFILHKNYTGSDPEVSLDGSGNGQGFANFVVPSNTSFIIGLKATL
ncbi:MAG: SusC/RagA family TonB-linked outer membrane protein [Mucilaginibacter sp.]